MPWITSRLLTIKNTEKMQNDKNDFHVKKRKICCVAAILIVVVTKYVLRPKYQHFSPCT